MKTNSICNWGTGLLFFLTLFVFVSCEPDITGTWIRDSGNPSKRESGALIFRSDGTFEFKEFRFDRTEPLPVTILNSEGKPILLTPTEGSEIPGSGRWRLLYQGKYELDVTKNPCWIDLIITNQNPPRRQQGLFRMPNGNLLDVCFSDQVRPVDFNTGGTYTPTRRATFEEEQEIRQSN